MEFMISYQKIAPAADLIKNTAPTAAYNIYHTSSKNLRRIGRARNLSYLIKNIAPAAAYKICHISSKTYTSKARNVSYLINNTDPSAAYNIYHISSKNVCRIGKARSVYHIFSQQQLTKFIIFHQKRYAE